MRTVAVVGLGFMGGSLAAALHASNQDQKVIGIEPAQSSAELALQRGLVDEIVEEVPLNVDFVALCVPSDTVAPWALKLIDHSATVVDIGSVKGHIVRQLEQDNGGLPANFVPCHPIAGSEKSGPGAADARLFTDRLVVMTPVPATSKDALASAKQFWQDVGAQTVQLSADAHDEVLATTSHLPHLLAFAFMLQTSPNQLEFAGGGFRDFTRIAAANPELWWRIFQLNRDELMASAKRFSGQLESLIETICDNDMAEGITKIQAAAELRKRLDHDSRS
jgi:prephenate dehydrogenase